MIVTAVSLSPVPVIQSAVGGRQPQLSLSNHDTWWRRTMAKTSELKIDSRKRSNGGMKLHMKWNSVPLWYIVILSFFALVEGRTGAVKRGSGSLWKLPITLSRHTDNISTSTFGSRDSNKLALIVPPADRTFDDYISPLRGGAALNLFPSGYNPFGYGLTPLGQRFLEFDGSLDSDVGR